MIVSHSRRFIFLKPMKVAGTSLEIALSKYCGPGDILTPFGQTDEAKRAALGYQQACNYRLPYGELGAKGWLRLLWHRQRPRRIFSHATAAEVRALVGATVWDSYTKLSVVRNPYDYAISRYYWEARLGPLPPFRQWLLETPEILLTNRRITHIDGHNQADVMIRYEALAEDLATASRQLGLDGNLWDDLQTIRTKTTTRPRGDRAEASFDDFEDGQRLVQMLCREDIDTYGYAPTGADGFRTRKKIV